jgi:hypothetical protein
MLACSRFGKITQLLQSSSATLTSLLQPSMCCLGVLADGTNSAAAKDCLVHYGKQSLVAKTSTVTVTMTRSLDTVAAGSHPLKLAELLKEASLCNLRGCVCD